MQRLLTHETSENRWLIKHQATHQAVVMSRCHTIVTIKTEALPRLSVALSLLGVHPLGVAVAGNALKCSRMKFY